MARGVTQEVVNRAADAVLQRGDRPTIEKVRAELGTGSPNTLIRMLDVWWADLAERLAAQARANLPGLPEAVQRAMLTVWSEAMVGARNEAGTAASERETALTQQLAATATNASAVSRALAERDQETTQLRTQIAQWETERATERARLTSQETALGQAVASLDALQRQLNEAHQLAATVAVRHQLELDRASQTEQRWLREVDRAREELKVARQQAKKASDTLERERTRHRKSVERLEADVRKWKTQAEALRKAGRATRKASRPARNARRSAQNSI